MRTASPDFLAGGGELGSLIRDFDWSRTSLGPPESWPRSLQLAVRIMLASRQPIWIGWGGELVYLYNDPYKAIVGGKHPDALGQPTKVVWREIWDVIAPMLETALTGEAGTYVESQLLIMERYGYREETYYTFSYSPIPADDGGAGGIICANTDDTRRVIGERQLALLRDLAAATADARTWEEVCARAAGALRGNPRDLPFALVYVADGDPATVSLAGAAGFDDAPVPDASAWGVDDVLGGREIAVAAVPASVGPLPPGAWDEPPQQVALVPLSTGGETGREGVLVVGINPFRRFDDAYADFLALVGGQISASIASVQAYEAERQRAEALAEIDRAKTVFFSNVSHEFRTPLTLMLGPLDEVLRREGGPTADDRESLEVVRRNALRLMRMVNTVLDFSRTGAERPAASFRPTELDAVTREIVERFVPLLDRAGLRLETFLPRLPSPVYVDGEAWEKIVLNLLSNAFKFTLAGEIRIELRAVEGEVRLQVADTGTGIPADELPHLFERFHRVRNEQARTYEGTGIGLALVRELVELHGGSVGVESTYGEGTTFTVSLPLGHAHLPAEQVHHERRASIGNEVADAYAEEARRWVGVASEGQPPFDALPADGAGRARVMVVDDNADMRDYIAHLLERHWHVDVQPDGRAALEAIREQPPDLVVTDVMMPRLDGFGLLEAIRADPETAPLPVIVVSARAGEESSVEGIDAGADDYLIKPFSARELVARVRTSLELARLRDEAGRLGALEEVRSRVITTASHELRTPVAAIFGAARTLERADGIGEEVRDQLLGVISRESERLARITSDMLTTEALASGTLVVTRERVQLDELLHEAVAAAKARLPDAAISLRDGVPVRVAADPMRLQQVVTNLLDNAIKYSPDGGRIDVGVETDDEVACIVVADQGIGIPDDAREQVFQRFYRVDPELRRGVGGSGLGLSISRELVEAMGGSIAVEPNEPQGTRFVVSLRRA